MLSTGIGKTIAFALFWGLALIILYLLFWRPGINSLKKAQEDITLKQNVLTQIKRDVEAWPKTLTAEKLKKAEEELEVLLAQIPLAR